MNQLYNYNSNTLTHSFKHIIYILVDWSELDNEEQYREKLREQQESRGDQLIDWEDDKEREYRRRYIDHKYFVHTFFVHTFSNIIKMSAID